MKKQLQRLLSGAIMAGLALIGATHQASASHFRGMSISWEQGTGAQSNEVTFHVTESWRWSAYGNPAVGTSIGTGNVSVSNGFNSSANSTVLLTNSTQDWFVSERTFTTTFSGSTGTYTAAFNSCCRISTLQQGNNDQNEFVSTTLVLDANGGARSPEVVAPGLAAFATDLPAPTTLPNNPYIVYLTNNATNVFNLGIAVPAPGANWTYGFSTTAESGLPTPVPTGMSIAANGLITWNAPNCLSCLYGTQIEMNNTVTGARWAYDLIFSLTNQPLENFWTAYTPTLPPEPDSVPAPGALLLLGAGLAGLASVRRRRINA